ncbi:MAG: hypothetical protein HOO06_01435 [Bdellovibrionaceae bacterium]|nr:hypothetical protein [Pseudobdellovibrionaceae bacterium]
MQSLFKYILLFIISSCVTGCGYHLGYGNRELKGGYKELAIPMFTNRTKDVQVEVYFTNALIREFNRSKVANITKSHVAPVTVEGFIRKIKVERQSPSGSSELPGDTTLAASYRIIMNVDLRLRRNSDHKIIWSSQFSGEKVYLAPQLKSNVINTANPLYNNSVRQQVYSNIAKDMMNEAYNRMTEVL